MNARLIVSADDLGLSQHRDMGIFDLIARGIITSVAVVVNTETFISSTSHEILKILSEKQEIAIGLHLNLTEGRPTSHLEGMKGFVDENGNMLGKARFHEAAKHNELDLEQIKCEIRKQIMIFHSYLGFYPTYINGHQHVHIIPSIANILGRLMNDYCIFRTRIPIELQDDSEFIKGSDFFQKILEYSRKSIQIFGSYGIHFPDFFIGINYMGSSFNSQKIFDNLSKLSLKEPTVELMCHPGLLPSENSKVWDEWDGSSDRKHEYEELLNHFNQVQLSKNKIRLISFKSLPIIMRSEVKKCILFCGEFTYGTGNNITVQRIQKMLNREYNVGVFNVNPTNSAIKNNHSVVVNYLIDEYKQILVANNVQLVCGINVYRFGIFINNYNSYWFKDKHYYPKVPTALIISGTDANKFLNSNDSEKVINEAVCNTSLICGLTQIMIDKFKTFYPNKKYHLIPQSVEIKRLPASSNIDIYSFFNKQRTSSSFFTIFPSGIRLIKDPLYVIESIKKVVTDYPEHYFALIGAILDKDLHKQIIEEIEPIKHNFLIKEQIPSAEFLVIMESADLMINTSISEGLSNCIMESMLLGTLVLARDNDSNQGIVKDCETGFLFGSNSEFYEKYVHIYMNRNSNELAKIIAKAKEIMIKDYNPSTEFERYCSFFEEIFSNYCFSLSDSEVKKDYNVLSPNVHPYSIENNQLFSKIRPKCASQELNILDVGSGYGAITLMLLETNPNIIVNQLTLTDLEIWCLYNSEENVHRFVQKNHGRIKKVNFVLSNLLDDIENIVYQRVYDESYSSLEGKSYDLIFTNLPQSPSINGMRPDKDGGRYGWDLYNRFFRSISPFMAIDAQIFFLNISISNPYNLALLIEELGLKLEIVEQQLRKVKLEELEIFEKGLGQYWLNLRDQGISVFEVENETTIKYQVYLKRVYQ